MGATARFFGPPAPAAPELLPRPQDSLARKYSPANYEYLDPKHAAMSV
jgi:hypothetical protein